MDAMWEAAFNRNRQYARPEYHGDFQTPVPAALRPQFDSWLRGQGVSPSPDYDYGGFWLGARSGHPQATQGRDPVTGHAHFTDYWKTPYHETFSRDSRYAKPQAPYWEGDRLYDQPTGRRIYDPRLHPGAR